PRRGNQQPRARAAIIEPMTAYGLPVEGVAVRPLDVDIPFLWGVVTALHAPLSATAQALLQHLDTAARQLLPDIKIYDAADTASLAEALYGAAQ
ncbi:MAG: hypothetical protein HY371_01465, partial [Devosia nanyangense]|nr:hypothetical protein [Devosia nanyangense]